MNRELKKVKKWLDANRLSLNINKTNFVIFHPPRIKILEPVIVKFGRKKIQREICVKFLGILLDANLSWKYHINELLKKLSRTLGLFYKIRYYVPLEILKQPYYSLFYSFVSYGITVRGLTYKSLVQKLIVIQQKIVRVMTFNKMNAHTNPIFIHLEFLKIEDIRQFQLLSFVYDCLNKTAPVFFHDYFTPSSERHTYNTRLASRGDLFLEHASCYSQKILFSTSLPVRFKKLPLKYVYQLNFFNTWSSSLLRAISSNPPPPLFSIVI